jgi:predicted patatin/cPLA2 family phospholipase
MMQLQEQWDQQLDKWRKTWVSFWQEKVDKSQEVQNENKRLDTLNGARWLFGAKDVYRLSHLLGGKFDSGLADLLMVHYQTYALTLDFLATPPDDCFIVQICPSEQLRSSPLLSSKEDLLFDYEMGLAAGKQFVDAYCSV